MSDLYDASWFDATMDASIWWKRNDVTPDEAATLLYGSNPLHKAAHGKPLTTRETESHEYQRLLRVFQDYACTDPGHRTLAEWLGIAKEEKLTHHPWIDAYLLARPQTNDATPPTDAQASKRGNRPQWSDDALRTLWAESQLAGATQQKLAGKHGVTRQRIGKLLSQAKNQFRAGRPSPFPPGVNFTMPKRKRP
ncbi:hypothetical protein [Paraburkholderia sediminicola]|uniref:hypothetical protein n=1 Tax=Paraburkholderia sediminicola TaxID=458836 RepID=UPI0038B9C5ED